MNLCKNCCFFRTPKHEMNVAEYATCAYGLVENPVTGDIDLPTQGLRFCITLRQSRQSTDCGPDARFYVEKQIVSTVKFPDLQVVE